MKPPRLYLDEDVYSGVALGLRHRGFDVLTTVDAGLAGSTDEEQLNFASLQQRALFTFNRGDFARIHYHLLSVGQSHSGIIVSRQFPVGVVVKNLCVLLSHYRVEDIHNQLIWLTSNR